MYAYRELDGTGVRGRADALGRAWRFLEQMIEGEPREIFDCLQIQRLGSLWILRFRPRNLEHGSLRIAVHDTTGAAGIFDPPIRV